MRWFVHARCERTMMDDRFVGDVDAVTEAGHRACEAVETAVAALLEAGEAHRAGRSLVDLVDDVIASGGREIRLSAADAFREYERSIASMRAGIVRALVDEEGLSLTGAAERMKISRQAAARLYRSMPERAGEAPD